MRYINLRFTYLPTYIPLLVQPLPGRLFQTCFPIFQHRVSGIRCNKQFSSATLCPFLNLDLKLFYSLRLLLNTDPTCRQRLLSYDHMALYKFDYYYYYYYFAGVV